MEQEKLILDVHEKPKVAKWIILAIQHVFAMFGATILVPILVNSTAGEEVLTIPVALVTSGIGTLIYILCTKGKSPVYLGSSFAFIAPLAATFLKGGTAGAMTGVMAVGIIYIIFAVIIKLIGKKWLDKLLPPVVIGPMIMIIGLGLAPSAISQIGLGTGAEIDWKGVAVALITFLTTAVVMVRGKGFIKIIPFLILKETKMKAIVLNNPLIQHKLSIIRDKRTGTKEFREIIGEIATFLCYEAMSDARLGDEEIETPICKTKVKRLDENQYAFVPILRAGTGMLDGLLKVMPNAKIGHVGLYRNETTLKPVRYYYKMPKDIANREVIVLDPMLATGGSAVDTITMLKEDGVKK